MFIIYYIKSQFTQLDFDGKKILRSYL